VGAYQIEDDLIRQLFDLVIIVQRSMICKCPKLFFFWHKDNVTITARVLVLVVVFWVLIIGVFGGVVMQFDLLDITIEYCAT
jgi:hypothetical protein